MELSSPANGAAAASEQPNIRKSGRVTHKPQKLSPSAAPRRRSTNTSDGEDDVDMDDVSSGDDIESDGEPDEEEVLEKKRRSRKRPSNEKSTAPAKRAKTNGASTRLAMRPALTKAKTTKKPGTVPLAEEVGGEVGKLYRSVFLEDEDAHITVKNWLQRFEADEALAVAEIVNFFLECAGCYIKVDQHDIDDVDNCTSKLKDIQDEFQATKVVDYPLIKQKTGPTFKRCLSAFVNAFIETLAETRMLTENPELLENVQAWVTPMSSAAARPIRHTSTIIALDVTSAFSALGRNFANRQAKLSRQAEGEEKNKKINKARVQDLRKQAEEAGERLKEISTFIEDWFDTVFVHRYRDIDPRVRVDCIRYLGEWVVAYPEHFLDGAHLRYLGWLLSDVNSATRQESMRQLQKLYKDDSKLAALRQFTERFRSRLVEIASQDAEQGARVLSVELLDILREKGFLEPDDIDNLGKLIYDTEPRIRKAIVPFLSASIMESYQLKLEELGEDELDDVLPDALDETEFQSPQRAWLKFKSLAELLHTYDKGKSGHKTIERQSATVELLKASGYESRFSIVAKAMQGSLEFLEDWQVIAGYLLHDHSVSDNHAGLEAQVKAQYKLTESEEIILLHVLNVSVRNALTSVMEELAASKKIKLSKKELEKLDSRRDAATQQLATIMPKLLAKFSAHAEAAAAVLQLARTLNLEVFHQLRQDSTTYARLLDNINKQFLNHEDHEVLDEATAAILYSKSFDDLEEITEAKLTSLWEDTTHKFVVYCKGEELEIRGSIQADKLNALTSTTFRLSKLASISDPADCLNKPHSATSTSSKARKRQSGQGASAVPITILLQLLARGVPNSGFSRQTSVKEDELVENVIQTLFFYFLWHVKALHQTGNKDLTSEEKSAVEDRREEYAQRLRAIVSSRRGADQLRFTATRFLLDLHTMFASVKSNDRVKGDTENRLSVKEQRQILRVFVAAEQAHAKKSGFTSDTTDFSDEIVDIDKSGSDLSDMEESDMSPDSSDGEGEEGVANKEAQRQTRKKQRVALLAEEALCDLSGRIALAIIAGVLSMSTKSMDEVNDRSNDQMIDVKKRFVKNKLRLGKNFKMLITQFEAALAEKEGKSTRSGKIQSTSKAAATTSHNTGNSNDAVGQSKFKSAAVVVEDEESGEEDLEAEREQQAEEDEAAGGSDNGMMVDGEDQDEAQEGRAARESESVLGD